MIATICHRHIRQKTQTHKIFQPPSIVGALYYYHRHYVVWFSVFILNRINYIHKKNGGRALTLGSSFFPYARCYSLLRTFDHNSFDRQFTHNELQTFNKHLVFVSLIDQLQWNRLSIPPIRIPIQQTFTPNLTFDM